MNVVLNTLIPVYLVGEYKLAVGSKKLIKWSVFQHSRLKATHQKGIYDYKLLTSDQYKTNVNFYLDTKQSTNYVIYILTIGHTKLKKQLFLAN